MKKAFTRPQSIGSPQSTGHHLENAKTVMTAFDLGHCPANPLATAGARTPVPGFAPTR